MVQNIFIDVTIFLFARIPCIAEINNNLQKFDFLDSFNIFFGLSPAKSLTVTMNGQETGRASPAFFPGPAEFRHGPAQFVKLKIYNPVLVINNHIQELIEIYLWSITRDVWQW